jgi:oligoendopeptidase F
VYDTLVGDRLLMDRLRHFMSGENPTQPLPMQHANMANGLPDAAIDALIGAVEDHYPLAQRYFRSKAQRLEQTALLLSDQYAPVGGSRGCTFEEA